ncbi:hypothetical protein GCM10010328_41890 [Streptomyces rubiginosohelvolus]|uniref:Uncharacterized protein n=1 Tax=Streptomyces rubiginosohelvolus TaxID=67362 RepID=A0ABQ3C2Q3_9ACTN|nr:hypothetical protein GCM10010328_41890 [Streptomyces pluricolorescens]
MGVARVTAVNQDGQDATSSASARYTTSGGADTSAANTSRIGAESVKSLPTVRSRRAIPCTSRRSAVCGVWSVERTP